jgi:hypothetical protein
MRPLNIVMALYIEDPTHDVILNLMKDYLNVDGLNMMSFKT